MSELQNKCQICQQFVSKYTCPKCDVPYCSVTCYKSQLHLKCSEQFYKDWIYEEMANGRTSKNDMKKLYDILKRVHTSDTELPINNIENVPHEELDSDDDVIANEGEEDENTEDDDLEARLQGVNINDADELWEALTPLERQDFQDKLASGDIMAILPNHEPWWKQSKELKIVELANVDNATELQPSGTPKLVKKIAKFSDICKKEPSNCLYYNLCNIMCAYNCMVRYFLGEHLSSAWEAAYFLVNLATSLKYNTNFEEVADAIVSVEMEVMTTNSKGCFISGNTAPLTLETRSELNENTMELMATSQNRLLALSDIYELFQRARGEMKRARKYDVEMKKLHAVCSGTVELTYSKLHMLVKKIQFLLSYERHKVDTNYK